MEENALRAEQLGTMKDGPHLEDLIAEFREMLPDQCGTAQAIDRKEPWERIALKAVDDGYIELAAARVRCRQLVRKRVSAEKKRIVHLICLNLLTILRRRSQQA